MRLDRIALALDAAMLLALLAAVAWDNLILAFGGLLFLLVLLALPLGPPGSTASPRTLAVAAIVLFLLVLALATMALRETGVRLEPSRDALPLLAVLAASAGLVGLVWAALWRAVALRPAPWKPFAFGLCLFFFLCAPAALVVDEPREGTLGALARFALVIGVVALAVAAALPFIDSVFRERSGQRTDASWKRL